MDPLFRIKLKRALKNIKSPHDLRSIAVFWIYSVWGFMFIGFLLLPFRVCKREEVRREVRSEDFILDSDSRIHTQSGSARGLGPLSARYGGAPSA